MAINWNDVKSRNILDAFRVALSDDRHLSHAEVVEVLRSPMNDGYLSEQEIDDLQVIAKTSERSRIVPRRCYCTYVTRRILFMDTGPSTSQRLLKYAADLIFSFMKRMGQNYFPKLDRDEVGIDLLLRVSNPNILNQRTAGICGPMAFLYSLAFDFPAVYAEYAIDLTKMAKPCSAI